MARKEARTGTARGIGWMRRLWPIRRRTRNDEAHLLSSPRNAERLLEALEGARTRTGTPTTIEALRDQYGLEEK